MVISKENKKHLVSMRSLEKLADFLKTEIYIWGGFTQDIYEGKFTREHSDVDCLIMNMNKLVDKIENFFKKEGWKVIKLDIGLSIKKGMQKIHIGNIETLNSKIKWTFPGEKNILFPRSWLNKKPFQFFGVKICVMKPEFEYAIRIYSNKSNPAGEIREKDKMAIKYFANILKEKHKNPDEMIKEMYYPF